MSTRTQSWRNSLHTIVYMNSHLRAICFAGTKLLDGDDDYSRSRPEQKQKVHQNWRLQKLGVFGALSFLWYSIFHAFHEWHRYPHVLHTENSSSLALWTGASGPHLGFTLSLTILLFCLPLVAENMNKYFIFTLFAVCIPQNPRSRSISHCHVWDRNGNRRG